ncbi:methylmalonyl-CoA epimerase [Oceanotoga sp. DSM 15011]|jgi:methylmalonyl-CoA/ethylmalonyl-CoA epimerase|uniref:Methylmalonyl-CoA epimerase n=1 Tax=Oceanotoga teriensis TaxID=515440 RepID=A0AA45C925_9BACT|nr:MULTISPECIES: methylmalonyl-CoA epimerase [Oceanotoga]MDN5341602.1 methylmalonyl-CoA/ethylmalonyl-CoA epimerase [Oceanotoga sp.]MDO7977194.1 methylmalonyl-CoA epimerase [Oceanotoga teriensis]PWJ96534.1 methylmalonyl-CoA epimerase [Oceanotoga teriensis]UYP00291.1 methylmalonyl-CoA epimerase [Oceanotoga sp. DSM 15011]
MTKIDHIGIAVNSIEEALPLYKNLLKIEPSGEEILEDRGLKVVFLEIGDTRIELLQPISDNSEVSKFLEKRGNGFHHIAYKVEDVSKAIEEAKNMGFKPLSDVPKDGAHNTLVAFLHPKSANGILTELVQHK